MKPMKKKGTVKQVKKQMGGFPKPRVTDPIPVGYPMKRMPMKKGKVLEDM